MIENAMTTHPAAWSKQIHIVDAIPLTTVGKIYKPQLRCIALHCAATPRRGW